VSDWYPKGSLAEPYLPQEIDDLELAFPAGVGRLLPPADDIPEDFKGLNTPRKTSKKDGAVHWVRFQEHWFFHGVDREKIKAKKGVDKELALRHLAAIQGSYEPKHEYKAAVVAYLASLWLGDWKP